MLAPDTGNLSSKHFLVSTVFTIVFKMYNDTVLICKQWLIDPIYNYIVSVDYCQNNQFVKKFTTYYIISKFKVFTNHKLDKFYITEIMRTECLQMIDEYRDEESTPYY